MLIICKFPVYRFEMQTYKKIYEIIFQSQTRTKNG